MRQGLDNVWCPSGATSMWHKPNETGPKLPFEIVRSHAAVILTLPSHQNNPFPSLNVLNICFDNYTQIPATSLKSRKLLSQLFQFSPIFLKSYFGMTNSLKVITFHSFAFVQCPQHGRERI